MQLIVILNLYNYVIIYLKVGDKRKIDLDERDINVIYESLEHLSKSTNILVNYDLWHGEEMPDSFAKDYYKLLSKLREAFNANLQN